MHACMHAKLQFVFLQLAAMFSTGKTFCLVSLRLSLVFFIICFVFPSVHSAYNPEEAINERLKIFNSVCNKYKDDFTYEYVALYKSGLPYAKRGPNFSYYYWMNIVDKFVICIPPKVASNSWANLMTEINLQSKKELGEENYVELATKTQDNLGQLFKESHK